MKNLLTIFILFSLIISGLLVFPQANQESTSHSLYTYSSPLLDPYPPPPTPYPGPQGPRPQEHEATPTSIPTSTPQFISFSITVSVEGLKVGEEAQILMYPITENVKAHVELNDIELPSITSSGVDQTVITENIPVGIYKVVIQAPPQYLRMPEGYIIRISEETVQLPSNQLLRFNLVSPNETSLPPCRNVVLKDALNSSTISSEDIPFVQQDICMAEGLVDVSSPLILEQLHSNSLSPNYGRYYYAGPQTTQDNQGIWGRNYVVDPRIIHGTGYDQFVAERVYVNQGSNWMEAGWTEKSWLDNRQYIYAMDSNLPESMIFSQYNISPGSSVETRVYYNSDVGKWRSTYYLGDGSWMVLREENLGFSIADSGYNRAEFWENIGILPLMGPSIFDKGYILSEGIWRSWDARYPTILRRDPPYQLDMKTEFNYFFVSSPHNYLPLILK